MRLDSGETSEWFAVEQAPRQGCVIAPDLFNIFFVAVLTVAFDRFSIDEAVLDDFMRVVARGDLTKETFKRVLWAMLYADDAGIVSRFLEKMMTAIVEVCAAFGLIVSEKKTVTMHVRPPTRKEQHAFGLAIKEEIVKKAGKDGIAIECISARLLKARIPIKSNFVTFVAAYASTGKAPEGQKAKYMAALNCTVASVPARKYVFVLTDANARTGKRGEGGGETDSKVLGAHGRDKLNENGKLLLGFAEDNKLALLNTFFCTPKSGVSYTFQSAFDYIWTKQADRRLIRCVNNRRPPLEAPESDHNFVYAKVRIPRRSAPNQRKRDSTKETPKLADIRRLMTEPNLQC